jgi:competence protein ComEC
MARLRPISNGMNAWYFLWIVIITLILTNLIIWLSVLGGAKDDVLKVAFLDVGQGDAIFIESPAGVQLLVDSGPNFSVLRQVGKQMSFFDRKLDAVLATHPDADHIGGFPEILSRFKVSNVFLTGMRSDTPVFDAYEQNIKIENAVVSELIRGGVIDLGGGAYAEVLFPDRSLRDVDPNTSSVIIRVVYGKTVFLLTGDAPEEVESYLALLDGAELKADVLKAGHHGSRTSTSRAFVSAVSPQYAVISAGCDNRYGHPHMEAIENIENVGAEIYSTCEHGAVVFESDGEQVLVR